MLEKSIKTRIQHEWIHLTYIEQMIAKYFLDGNELLSMNDLAIKLSVSQASISRFCRKLGLTHYRELVYLYNLENHQKHENIPGVIKEGYYRVFDHISESYNEQEILKTCELINSSRIIHVFGLGLSALAGQDFKFRFSRMGKFIEVVHDRSAIAMIEPIILPEDLVIILTLRGNETLLDIAKKLFNRGVKVVVITGKKDTKLKKQATSLIQTSTLEGEESTGMMSGQVPILVQIDLLYQKYITLYNDSFDSWVSTERSLVNDK